MLANSPSHTNIGKHRSLQEGEAVREEAIFCARRMLLFRALVMRVELLCKGRTGTDGCGVFLINLTKITLMSTGKLCN